MLVEKSKIGFDVEERDLFEPVGDLPVGSHKAIVDTDNNRIVSVVSKRYTLVKHDVIAESLESQLSRFNYEPNYRLEKGGARFFSEYKFPDITVDVGENDPISMKIFAKNSYDGSSSINFNVGAFRMVCENSLVPGTNIFFMRKRHIGDVDMEKIAYDISRSISIFKTSMIDKFKIMSDTEISDKKAILLLEDVTSEKGIIGPRYKDKTMAIYNREVEIYNKVNMWLIYNAITYILTHYIAQKRYERSLLLQSKAFNQVMDWSKK